MKSVIRFLPLTESFLRGHVHSFFGCAVVFVILEVVHGARPDVLPRGLGAFRQDDLDESSMRMIVGDRLRRSANLLQTILHLFLRLTANTRENVSNGIKL